MRADPEEAACITRLHIPHLCRVAFITFSDEPSDLFDASLFFHLQAGFLSWPSVFPSLPVLCICTPPDSNAPCGGLPGRCIPHFPAKPSSLSSSLEVLWHLNFPFPPRVAPSLIAPLLKTPAPSPTHSHRTGPLEEGHCSGAWTAIECAQPQAGQPQPGRPRG